MKKKVITIVAIVLAVVIAAGAAGFAVYRINNAPKELNDENVAGTWMTKDGKYEFEFLSRIENGAITSWKGSITSTETGEVIKDYIWTTSDWRDGCESEDDPLYGIFLVMSMDFDNESEQPMFKAEIKGDKMTIEPQDYTEWYTRFDKTSALFTSIFGDEYVLEKVA